MAANAPDRNLLFGLLALQNGLINQAQLVATFQAWTLDRARALADHFIALGHLNQAQRAVVEAMADLHVAKHGDIERSLAAVSAGRSTRESLAQIGDAQIHATLARLGSGLTDRDQDADADSDRTASYAVGTATSDGQRFRVLRPHARGGLGAVFVALDEELHREVALKQILHQHADDPTSRQRFVLEAEITGGLEHPGIVPVYGLGTYADGRPYYAMRFINGDSLKEAIEAFHDGADVNPHLAPPGRGRHSMWRVRGRRAPGLALAPSPALRTSASSVESAPSPRGGEGDGKSPLAFRKLLRRFLDVCNAIDYAHSRGVLHRDIKPGNIIVGKHGETLVVDWGLAKATGRSEPGAADRTLMPSSASGSAETLPGTALGTPAYMSPEQASGDLDRLGPRSDVYSLGATLFCLLTGKPPFENDEDIGAVLRAVGKGDFPTPRILDPSIDRALEAVCLKAMALKPEDRYPTARALADDVERWAADEPVTAWREPITRRMQRWARRNRTAVSVAATSILVAVVGLVAVIAVQNRANAALTDANTRLELSNRREVKANADLKAANERVRSRFALAEEAIQKFHTGISEDLLLKQKEFGDLRTGLLRGARDFYQKLEHLLEGQADRDSRMSLARTYRDVGGLTQEIETLSNAIPIYRHAVAILEGLAREYPSDTEVRRELGWTNYVLGSHLTRQDGGSSEGLADLERARDILESIVAARPSDRAGQADLARVDSYLSDYHQSQLQFGAALEASVRVCRRWESLIQTDPEWDRARFGLAIALDSHASILQRLERFDESLEPYAKARRLAEGLVPEFPANREYGHELVRVLGNMALPLSTVRRFDEASALLAQAREVIRTMTEANPNLLESQADLISVEEFTAYILVRTDRSDEAILVLDRARMAQERLLKVNPNDVRWQERLARILRTQSACHVVHGRLAQARPLAQRVQSIVERMAEANPTRLDVQVSLDDAYLHLGAIDDADQHPDRARGYYEKALAARQRRVEADPSDEPAIPPWPTPSVASEAPSCTPAGLPTRCNTFAGRSPCSKV
jgi:serine/threonine-protein kinase